MRILILGAGAVGGYVGARLLAAGADVFFLARGERLKNLNENGLVIRSPLGGFSGRPKVGSAPVSGFSPDVAVVACKAPALQGALQAIAPFIGRETRVLPLLNGISHLDLVRDRFPRSSVLGGVTHGALTLSEDGAVDHLSPFFSMICGPISSQPDPIAEAFVAVLEKSGVDAQHSAIIVQNMWNKFVFLAAFAGITCLMRADVGTIMGTADGEELVLGLLEENLAVARAEGFEPNAAAMTSYRQVLTERGSTLTSSMLRDVLGGRRTEADHILGDMLRRARQHGLHTPLLKIVNANLDAYESTVS